MEKLAENDLTYFYLRHVVIVVTAVTTISLTPVIIASTKIKCVRPFVTLHTFLSDSKTLLPGWPISYPISVCFFRYIIEHVLVLDITDIKTS